MPLEYLRDGEMGFIGLNSRDNPSSIPQGYVSKSQNFRLDRGVASVRKGTKKFTDVSIDGKKINGCGIFLNGSGQETIVLVVHNDVANTTSIVTFNPETEDFGGPYAFPSGQVVSTNEGCDVVQAMDKVYISRGHAKDVIQWTFGTTTFSVLSHTGGHEFPHCSGMMFYQNRMVVLGKHKNMSSPRERDTVAVSNFLDFSKFDLLDSFTINQGGNDEVVSVVPWTMNEFLIMMRNSIFYLNVGTSRYSTGDPLSNDAFLQTMSVDVGCVAKRSAVQVAGGVVFLSDTGVYFLQPQQVGAAEGMRLLTLSEPLSAQINDVILRINRSYAKKSVAIYWDSRYYLAVPLDGSTKNNAVLVYNFILKAWESVDIYPSEYDAFQFLIAKKGTQRRLFSVDTNDGIFLMEENDWDEHSSQLGHPFLTETTPVLPFPLGLGFFRRRTIDGIIVTRRFTFNQMRDKRFSSIESDLVCPAGSVVVTHAEINNPDVSSFVDRYGSPSDSLQDTTRRNPVRKIGYGLQIRYNTTSLRPSIRASFVNAVIYGKNNINLK
jgi:hypothetical protein